MKNANTIKVWMFNNDGTMVAGNVEVKDMEHARGLARDWNRTPHSNPSMKVDIIQNAKDAREATQVSALY